MHGSPPPSVADLASVQYYWYHQMVYVHVIALHDRGPAYNGVLAAGGELAPGWRVEIKTRNSGTSAGTSDAV